MIIYCVMATYSATDDGYHIESIFSDKTKAETYIKKLETSNFYRHDIYIEEWTLDEELD